MNYLAAGILLSGLLSVPGAAGAQLAGEPFIHDPSTITLSAGKYYTFGTGRGGLVSEDGWTWHSGGVRPGGGVAPDVIKIEDRYYVAYAVGGGGMNGGHASNVKVMWTKTLDPAAPDFSYHDVGVVASSDGVEDCDAIDPAFLLADGRLWLSYGTYFGYIRMVELDPKTGHGIAGNQPVDVAIDMEATALMYRGGWYYLLGTHATCCDGPNSSYNIRVGRSRNPTGPFIDNMGVPLLKGGGKLVIAGRGRNFGPGHFGLMDLGGDLQKFSMHYESDMDRAGRSVLAIQPLLWKDGWPMAGDNLKAGTYEIQSERSGGALELDVDFVRIDFDFRRAFGPPPAGPLTPLSDQTLAQDMAGWPSGSIKVDLGDYMIRPHQKWTIIPVPQAGGYMGLPFYKIVVADTDRALAATAEGEVVTDPAYTGAPDQLWRIDQLTDGTYRISPKTAHGPMVLGAVGASTVALMKFDPKSDAGRWTFKAP